MNRRNSGELAAVLTQKLLDDNLMKRYGTSLSVNMGRDYQKYLDQKYLQLKAEFDQINKNTDEVITIDELKDFINTKAGEIGLQYDNDYIERLFNLVDVDSSSGITLQEFIMAYMLLEEKLRLKNIKLKKLEEDLLMTKDKYLKGMNDNKEERFNEHGVSTTSTLSVQVLEARDLKPMNMDGYCDPYVQLSINNSKVLTSYKPTTLNPIWNEEFSLMAPNKNLSLKVEVFNKRRFGGDEIIGTVIINLKSLEDQLKHDDWYRIETPSKQENGEIRLRLQFIWSKYKYFSDNFTKTENQLKRLNDDFEELNRFMKMFDRPFGLLIYGEVNNINEKRILERAEDLGLYTTTNRKTVFVSPRGRVTNYHGLAERVENVFRATFSNIILTPRI